VAYYCEKLGFECPDGVFVGVGDTDEGGVYAILRRDGARVHLQIRRGPWREGARPGIESDVYFYVADADALHAEFEKRGASVFRKPVDNPYGLRDFVVEDLDGNRLLFGSPLPG
jgi:uncharacterized glyoxalase superfamily protein PhnB